MFYQRFYKRISFMFLVAAVLTPAALPATTLAAAPVRDAQPTQRKININEPVNIAILIQDDLVSSVGNEIRGTSDFIRSLPSGSRVMVGYITSGTLQVRQPFTTDLNSAARSLRILRFPALRRRPTIRTSR